MKKNEIGIGLLGLGVVGGGVARVLLEKARVLSRQVGCPLVLKKVLVRDIHKSRSVSVEPSLVTTEPEEVLGHPGVDVVVELMGGESAALSCIQGALSRGRHVVTANKEVIARHGPSLLSLAQKNGVELRFEASVGGGIPLVEPFQRDLVANDVSAIHSILNGTTNYILTRMSEDGMDFSLALKQAQERGYAEPDPSYDIEGIDATFKLAILASLAFRSWVDPQMVFSEGISHLEAKDFRYARELGYAIKLLAIAKRGQDSVEARVHPVLVAEDSLLAQVRGVYNAVQVEGDLVGRVILYGRGAGAQPTSSAVVADIVAVARNIFSRVMPARVLNLEERLRVRPMSEVETRYYMRMNVADQPGVLAQISKVLGDNRISISQVIQKETDESSQSAEIVIMTHVAREEAMQRALVELKGLGVVREINNFIRVDSS
ncbi:MAG: homoserine dehydrogenase [Chloroflexota bacterium]